MTLTCVEKTAKEQRLEKEVKVNVSRVSGMLLSENTQRKMFFSTAGALVVITV